MSETIALPPARLALGITGHRESNATFAASQPDIERALAGVFDLAVKASETSGDTLNITRLHSLLAHGSDLIAVEQALERGWGVTAPLPFGLQVNIAINADPPDADNARAYLAGQVPDDDKFSARAAHIAAFASRAHLFELAEEDDKVTRHLLAMLRAPGDVEQARLFTNIASERVALAGRIMIEQSDLLIAIWDGVTPGGIGGTRHTIATAVKLGIPVIWIDAASPKKIAILQTIEELHAVGDGTVYADAEDIERLFERALFPAGNEQNERAIRFHTEQWHPHSNRRFHAYRRIEALWGGGRLKERFAKLTQHYEVPEKVADGSGAAVLAQAKALPGGDAAFAQRIEAEVLQRFAWADGLSTYLSDAYRGGMVTNFLLSAMAIVVGVAYMPFASIETKWPFALAEFLLLVMIVLITGTGRRKKWHGRWFETRRVAEYFRHAPIMLLLGVARAQGRWPRGADTEWPEFYAREVLREIGLPAIAVSQDYLRALLEHLLLPHATTQRRYHEGKARRLTRVHHGLDRMSESLFALALLSVASYLILYALGAGGTLTPDIAHDSSKLFTFLGIILPALGGTFAGIRYFGDFERFASISEVTAEKLSAVERRIAILLSARKGELHYGQIADLAHSIDDIVVTEIENWQSVFGSKQIAVPV